MKKVLAVCNTPLQVVCALNLKYTFYKNDYFDIVISDHMNASHKYVNNIKKNKLFNKVFYVESHDFCWNKEQSDEKSFLDKLKEYTQRNKIMSRYFGSILPLKNKYDVLLFNNIDRFNVLLYENLWRNNKHLQAYMFEDGYSSYYAQGLQWRERYNNLKTTRQIIKNIILGAHPLETNINGQYLYKPEAVEWEAPFERIKMREIDVTDTGLVNQLNQLFGYKDEEKYDEPIIFFEESFRREGLDIGDIQLVQKIAEIVGKENILIKPHPRNNVNEYKKLGFKTVETSTIPWEIIVINHPEYADKLLVSVGSGAIATPYTMFGIKTNSVVLLDLINANFNKFHQVYFKYMKDRVFCVTPEVFFIPQNEKQMIDIFTKWKESKKRND